MTDREQDAIDRSLRRQFEPPDLGALEARIAAAAQEAERGDPSVAQVELPGAEAAANDTRPWGLAVAVAVAAAIVLLLAWPGQDGVDSRAPGEASIRTPPPEADAAGEGGAQKDPPTQPEEEVDDGRIAMASTSRRVAGRQLHDFLHGAKYEEAIPGDADCSAAIEVRPASCDMEAGAPALPPAPDLALVWECGGMTGIDCAAHELPAQRLMIVRQLPEGPDVIICIEPPDMDPHPELPGGSDLNIFRRTLGDYVLYEVTPLGEPTVFDRLTI